MADRQGTRGPKPPATLAPEERTFGTPPSFTDDDEVTPPSGLDAVPLASPSKRSVSKAAARPEATVADMPMPVFGDEPTPVFDDEPTPAEPEPLSRGRTPAPRLVSRQGDDRPDVDRSRFLDGLGRAAPVEPSAPVERSATPPSAVFLPPPAASAAPPINKAKGGSLLSVLRAAAPRVEAPDARPEWTWSSVRQSALVLVLFAMIGYALYLDKTSPDEARPPMALAIGDERALPRSLQDRLPQAPVTGPAPFAVISTPPGARVLLDGVFIGKTPLVTTATPTGPTLEVLVELAGHFPYQGDVVRSVNGNFRLEVALDPHGSEQLRAAAYVVEPVGTEDEPDPVFDPGPQH